MERQERPQGRKPRRSLYRDADHLTQFHSLQVALMVLDCTVSRWNGTGAKSQYEVVVQRLRELSAMISLTWMEAGRHIGEPAIVNEVPCYSKKTTLRG
jgi:hypothetical protein